MATKWIYLILLPSLSALPDAVKNAVRSQTPFITNGERAKEGEFPWQAAVYADSGAGRAFCGGSLVADSWVLTAAHCATRMKNFTVVLGAHRLPDDAESSRQVFALSADQAHVHPQWNPLTLTNDIALLRLPAAAVLNVRNWQYIAERVATIPLATGEAAGDAAGAVGIVSGWGLQSDKDNSTAEYLQFVRQKIISNRLCNVFYAFRIRSTHICMSGVMGKSPCQGDSGGPLVVREGGGGGGGGAGAWRQVGLVSFGVALGCELGWPAVFTRLSSYVHFVSQVTGIHFT